MGKCTCTKKLRRLLDERGVEHEDTDITVGEKAYGATTYWECGDVVARFSENADVGTLLEAWDVSPEQAIVATVGVGTCKNIGDGTFVCSECEAHVQITYVGRSYLDENGKRWYSTSNEHEFRHCPNCGARIVEEEDE